MNTEHTKHPCETVDASADVMKLAEMILSDCGCSTAISDSLQRRVAGRIQLYVDSALGSQQQAEPAAPAVKDSLTAQPEPAALSLPFFAYDSETGFERFATDAEAKQYVQDGIDECRSNMLQGEAWPSEIENLCWGVVLGTTKEIKLGEAEDGSGDYYSDYVLTDAAQPPAVAVPLALPDWMECDAKVQAGTANALERFIYENEPAGDSDAEFRAGLLAILAAAPQAAVPDEVAKDAARYRWLRQDESEFSSMAPAELDAAIDKAIAAAQKGGEA